MKKNFIIIILFFLTQSSPAQNKQPQQIDDAVKQQTIENIHNALDAYYVFPEKAILMNEYINLQNKNGEYISLTDPNDFAGKILKDMLSVYNDKHLRIIYEPELEQDIIKFNASKTDASVISQKILLTIKKIIFISTELKYCLPI